LDADGDEIYDSSSEEIEEENLDDQSQLNQNQVSQQSFIQIMFDSQIKRQYEED